jgi:hypothetical protein
MKYPEELLTEKVKELEAENERLREDLIVERLRGHVEIMARDKGKFVRFIDAADCAEAADTIEALREEVQDLMDELAYHGVYPK